MVGVVTHSRRTPQEKYTSKSIIPFESAAVIVIEDEQLEDILMERCGFGMNCFKFYAIPDNLTSKIHQIQHYHFWHNFTKKCQKCTSSG